MEQAFNARDVDALVALYADDACLVQTDGSVAKGHGEIRRVWEEFVALDGRISMATQYAVETGDTALLSNSWRFTSADLEFNASSAEVAVRDGDGRWRYLIDNPFGGAA